LDEGVKLRAILEDFYDKVYRDERLAPFFHRVTKDHAIGKQYAFLADLFTGRHDYFGLKPFNAHHWMVISDELFDYRERLICDVMRKHGLSEEHVRRWTALHELFRREMVKSAPRGLIVDGVEHEPEKITDEKIEVATMCDGCHEEMPEGSMGRLLWRTGELFCRQCAAKKRASALPPSMG
jgi:truncated hemoglobin YjbI